MKRAFDFVASSLGLLLTFPLLLVVAIWVKLDSAGPVFYRPVRAGKDGTPLRIFKFRSMVVNADQIGGMSTSGTDPRVTRSGRFIRKCKLDELSQLINVFLGQMSLVGPRPEVFAKVEAFTEKERRTLTVRPGITDWASIWNSDEGAVLEGAPDADAVYEEVIKPTKRRLQLYYCDNRSFFSDLKIVFGTVYRIVNKHWVPRELADYPDFNELRAAAEQVIARQQSAELLGDQGS